MTTANTNTDVARTILLQLGGRRFMAMTGATNFIGGQHSLTFRIPKAVSGINCVKISLTPADTYSVEFMAIRGLKVRAIKSLDDVYCDQLQEVFTRATGLYTRL